MSQVGETGGNGAVLSDCDEMRPGTEASSLLHYTSLHRALGL